MPDHVIKLIQDVFYESNKEISNGTIMILGISYKPNVKDIQLTPAEQIIKKLQSFGVKIKIFDPFYKNEKVFDITVENNLFENLSECDGLVIVTNHDEFSSIDLKLLSSKMKFPIVIDSRGLIQKNDAEKAGLIFRGLGQ
jgi:UDP-N-acetyl-D-mannosaminuronate dehydrogenase